MRRKCGGATWENVTRDQREDQFYVGTWCGSWK